MGLRPYKPKYLKINLAKNELVNQNHLGWLADWQYTYSCRQSQPAQMRVLLRNTKTGFYFQSPEAWTSDDSNALDFHHSAQAIKQVCDMKLKGVELLLAFDDSQQNIRMPLRESSSS